MSDETKHSFLSDVNNFYRYFFLNLKIKTVLPCFLSDVECLVFGIENESKKVDVEHFDLPASRTSSKIIVIWQTLIMSTAVYPQAFLKIFQPSSSQTF